ncbi:CDP-alcohol phosphatidyltransferase family protein [Zobellia galactanivorans]|uniref:Phosphatidylserine synthase n=1 Tax=Zobellia galactanivorans (strain DSM 12802 / CCUG 47099 / CIP 106680 / NCIMB 13871 / Dsij) TaxID=63186 RepID=G0LCQ3_ZOBGA|nr:MULTISPECIES: CDP-alcohol phosphatidyltransferase family protein [Zobellia]MBU3025133.1 CDP-alcohol phosphatidyltransferase family protein [Zobellia galactanivorans]MDO6810552.1 CDP-alcohol phosphatidyltransferase family protein [Zobellia galactanivorans]OWW25277.1 phosphatidylserine synthase [Zobellia sp. OII3]CAZ97097.1 phosphatidylserine synthase [Zobellia galactanivorans]
MKKYIPNLITLLNVFCGCVATVFAVSNQLEMAALFVFLGIFFDFFDGLAARVLKVQSELGVQLDSLADMITSGLVPGIVMYQLLAMAMGGGWHTGDGVSFSFLYLADYVPFLGFLITLGSAYRLAKFNIDENQVSSFVGLPTPANALLILSLALILQYQNNDALNGIILNQWFLIFITALSTYLLNANIPLFALKFKTWSFKDNAVRYIFLIVSAVLLLTLKFLAVPCIIVFYVVASLVANVDAVKNRS